MIEQIDVLNANGARTGATKPKPDAHRDGDWHRAAHLWIVTPDRRVLLQRRSRDKENWPGLWDVSVAGHLSAGETAEEAAVREAREEIGLEVDPSALRRIGTLRQSAVLNDGAYLDNELHDIFLLEQDVDPLALTLQEGEVDAVMLLPIERLAAQADLVPHEGEYALLMSAL
ncbi:MAG TPA: NUDIX domain-containing protein [Thermoanaerobaculia bacterium]|nr:NUDIX domain-containing protein [Thermoanaerobaculia bacterium]